MDTEERVIEVSVLTHMHNLVAAITRCEQNAFSDIWTDVVLTQGDESIKIVGPINKVEWILRELNPRTPWHDVLNSLDDL